jgi:hypothetical protein
LHPDVDWKGLAGFRNVLVHDYLGVHLEYVYRAVERDVPRLKEACEAALKEVEDQKQVHAPHNTAADERESAHIVVAPAAERYRWTDETNGLKISRRSR